MSLEDLPDVKGSFGPFLVIEIAKVTLIDRTGIYYMVGKLNNQILVAASEIKFN